MSNSNSCHATVGQRVGVFWDGEGKSFYGKVLRFDPEHNSVKQYLVRYDDGEKEWEPLENLNFNPVEEESEEEETADGDGRGVPGSMYGRKRPYPDGGTEKRRKLKHPKHEEAVSDEEEEVLNIKSSKKQQQKAKDTVVAEESSSNGRKKKKRFIDKKNHPAIGWRCKVYWAGEKQFFYGKVVKIDMDTSEMQVRYDDGDREWEAKKDVILVDDGVTEERQSSEQKSNFTSSGLSPRPKPKNSSANAGGVDQPPSFPAIKDKANSDSTTVPVAVEDKGADSVGWKVEVELNPNAASSFSGVSLPPSINTAYHVVGYDSANKICVVAQTGISTSVMDVFKLDFAKGLITQWIEKSRLPLLEDRVIKGDVQSVTRLLDGGADPKVLRRPGNEGGDSVFQRVLRKTPPGVRTDMLKFLLDIQGVHCNTDACVTLLQRCVESFKDHILMSLIVKRIRGLVTVGSFDEEETPALFRYCVDHILKLNAAEHLNKVDEQVMSLLANSKLFALDMPLRSSTEDSKPSRGGDGSNNRSTIIEEGTPLVYALARGNISMAMFLIDKEMAAGGDSTGLSTKHWDCKLSEQWSCYADSWNLAKKPVRLVLFFFIVTKSFSDTKALASMLDKLVKLGCVDLNAAADPDLLFLCTLQEKKLQIRIREALIQLLTAGADANHADASGLTPLIACVRFRAPRFIKLLVQTGNADPQLGSPLVEACEMGAQEEIEALISVGAALTPKVFSARPPGFVSQLFAGHKVGLLKKLLATIAEETKSDIKGRLLVDACCMTPSPDSILVDFLLDNNVDCAYVDEKRCSAINMCVAHGHAKLLKILLNKVDIDVDSQIDPQTGEKLLVRACNLGEQSVVKVLLEAAAKNGACSSKNSKQAGTDKSDTSLAPEFELHQIKRHKRMGLRDASSGNALIAACKNGNPALVRTLLAGDDSSVNFVTTQGWTSLHLASAMGFDKVVSALLEYGARATVVDDSKRTPLCWACIAGHPKIIKVLIKKGGSDINHRDLDGISPLQLAIKHGNFQAAMELVQDGAKLETVNLKR